MGGNKGPNKARNQLTQGGAGDAQWHKNKVAKARKARKAAKLARKRSRG